MWSAGVPNCFIYNGPLQYCISAGSMQEWYRTQSAHTILLVQPGKKPEGRTYSDYESINECLEGVCKIFEEYLKKKNPDTPSITYDISELFNFVDSLSDLSCLVFTKVSSTYVPHNKDWIKEKIYMLLLKEAGKI